MRYDTMINNIRNNNNGKIITKDELFDRYKKIYNNDNLKTFENLISYLKSKQVITSYSKDKFLILTKRNYEYKTSDELKMLEDFLDDKYPDSKHIVWETKMINEFTHHYAMNNFIIVETEKNIIPYYVYALKDKFNGYVIMTEGLFLKSRDFITNDENVIIVKALHSKAPLNKDEKLKNKVSIEKIIVDFIKDDIFLQFQGHELEYIVENIIDYYDLNFLKLLNYAKVRGVYDDVAELFKMIKNTNYVLEA